MMHACSVHSDPSSMISHIRVLKFWEFLIGILHFPEILESFVYPDLNVLSGAPIKGRILKVFAKIQGQS